MSPLKDRICPDGRKGRSPASISHVSSFSDSLVSGDLRFLSDHTEESGWNSWAVGEGVPGLLGSSLIVE